MTGVFFLGSFFLSFCVPKPLWRTANPTALTLAPLSDLIGSDIILFKSALLWVASGEGQAARGQGHAQGTVGHALFCFFSSEGVGSLGGLPLVLLLQRPLPCLAAATPSTSISPA